MVFPSMGFVAQEDDKIIELIAKHGPKKWSTIARSLPGRIGKQCRERSLFESSSLTVVIFTYIGFTVSMTI